ncbi:YciI family protein [Beijerinckia sp. L45]|uniref:YciI family protein n=1 Tax=Beijerinckia sp. L45 TaxID=1641855 RepID=UPI00131C08DA|nr:YciI family protein [Beijerinckia sp. L45]
MSRFIALFHDAVDPTTVDAAVSAAHFAYLEHQQGAIVLAGGLRPDAGQPFCGAMWIMSVADHAAAERLVEDDPYRLENVWSKPTIYHWGKAPFYGSVTL